MPAQVIDLFKATKEGIEKNIKKLFSKRDLIIIVDHFLSWADFDYKEKKECVKILFDFQTFLEKNGTDLISFANYTIDKPPISAQKRIVCEFFIHSEFKDEQLSSACNVIGLFTNCLILKRTNGITIRGKQC